MLDRTSKADHDDGGGVQVTRRRRRVGIARVGRPRRIAAVGVAAVALVGAAATYASTEVFGHNQVGTKYANGIQVSDNQLVKPLGGRLLTQFGKFMGSTVSPDGRFLAATSTDKSVVLQVFDLSTYKLVWTVGSADGVNEKLTDRTVGQEGPTFSPDGKFLWLPERDGLTRFAVSSDGTLGTPTAVALPKVGDQSALVGQTKYSPDGSTLYAAINGQNTVVALDPNTGAVERTWDVGIAPRELAFVGSKLYVSNEGGRRAQAGDTTLGSYGTQVPADGHLGTSTTGTVGVIDTANASASVGSVAVGLHPTAMYVKGNALFVANTNSDTVSVIDTTKDQVVQTIETRPWPSSDVGYAASGIAMTDDGHLLVTLGRANAVAVYQYHGDPQQPVNYIGLLPTDYYPATVATAGGQIVVTNTRGIGARGPELSFDKGQGTMVATGHGTHSTTASLTRFTLPSDKNIARDTDTVFAQNGWGKNDVKQARGNKQHAVPVPSRIGDPSTIKHVFLLVKENRAYDQVYGDMAEGNGDASLAQFGAKVTPNQHALAKQFGLYDNTYDIGTNSAEGHNWVMQGNNPEYTESSAGEYKRSYVTQEDVLGHQRSGFLWTAIGDAGNSARNYGEFIKSEGKPKPAATWQQYYCATKSVENGGDPAQLTTPDLKGNYGSVIPSLNAITDPQSPPFDTSIPDIYRNQIWKQDFEKNGPAKLNMMWLSSDHTGGPPDPEAQVADGDLAVGKIVDEISHSKHWKDSAIFVVEDDSQNGADHVDGHRAPIQVISPWAAHGVVNSTYYSQLNMVRTIEQILGAQPLNQKLAAATPMYGAFTKKPDYTPFTAVKNQVPLTEGLATVVRPGHSGPDRDPGDGAEQGAGQEERGARRQDRHRRRLADLARQAAHHRQGCGPRLRQPGADEPIHVVPDPPLEGALPGRREDLHSVAGPGWRHPELGHALTGLPAAPEQHQDATARRSSGGPSRLAVRARAISKSFGGVVALDGVDLGVAEGQVHGLVGPNGAGKTTLLGLLLGLTQADGGDLEILGSPVRRRLALPDGVAGFVDGPGLYPSLTARQNLAALARLRGDGPDGVGDALEHVGLTDVADDRVRGFSLGMRQRLGLAAALLTRPRLLVLDEPANGLDPAGKRHVHGVLTGLAAQGTAVVLSSHRMDDLAALCSEVTLLATGRVVFSGPVSELAADADELDYRLRTSDPAAARRVAADTPELRVLSDHDVLDAEALLVRAAVPVLEHLVARLVGAGVGVRELAPVVAPLEAAFLALTAAANAANEDRDL